MNTLLPVQGFAAMGAMTLRLYARSGEDPGSVAWRINGFRAKLLVWTEDEWQRMEARPTDAQHHPSGVWCALRMD